MDVPFGIRYQIWDEKEHPGTWIPTLTARAGAILPGTYDEHTPMAPGNGSAAVEPSFMARKHFGWEGFGMYGDVLYRWMRTSGVDQYIVATGFLQQIKNWELALGYRHLQGLSGTDIVIDNGNWTYSPQVKEIANAIEGGFSYTTPKRQFHYSFLMRKTLDGRNTGSALTFGLFVDFPIGGQRGQ